jgi:hypothetical protein
MTGFFPLRVPETFACLTDTALDPVLRRGPVSVLF